MHCYILLTPLIFTVLCSVFGVTWSTSASSCPGEVMTQYYYTCPVLLNSCTVWQTLQLFGSFKHLVISQKLHYMSFLWDKIYKRYNLKINRHFSLLMFTHIGH